MPSFVRDAAPVLWAFALSRIVIVGVILLSKTIIVRGIFWRPGGLLEVLTNWDGVYYLHIARHGYFDRPETKSLAAFFPVYPMIVKAFAFVFHDFRVAGLVAANVCLLAAALLLDRLIRVDFDRTTSRAAVMLLMFSPVSFFFSSSYTESTFLLLAVGAFLAALQRRWVLAVVCGICLSATRNVGLWIAVPLFMEHARQTWDRSRPFATLLHPRVLLLALVPLGLGVYMLFSYAQVGDFLAFSHGARDWGRALVSPVRTLATAKANEPFYRFLFLGSLSAALLLWGLGCYLKIRSSYLVWAALLIATYLCSNSLEAIPRYLSVVFPLFIVLGIITTRARWTYEPILLASAVLLTICTILSANGYWMT